MDYKPLEWKDATPYSEEHGDVYFSRVGGLEESRHVFIEGNDLPARFAGARAFTILETGFGTGLNFVLTAQAFLAHAPAGARLDYTSIDAAVVHPDDIRELARMLPGLGVEFAELLAHYPLAVPGIQRIALFDERIRLSLLVGDIDAMLPGLAIDVDAWYLDGFSPASNPAMWSTRVFSAMARCSRPGTTLATYTVAGTVRRGLADNGFRIGRAPGYGSKREMLVGEYAADEPPPRGEPWYALPPCPPRSAPRIAVIGAGIAGLTTALQLVRRGFEVVLFDRERDIAQGASGNPAGLMLPRLSVDDPVDNRFFLQAAVYACHQYGRLQASSSERFWFPTGVDVGMPPARAGRLGTDPSIAMLPAAAGDRPHTDELAWKHLVHAGWLLPVRLCAAIHAHCGAAVSFVQAPVHGIVTQQDGGVGLVDDAGVVLCGAEAVVLANATAVTALAGIPALPLTANLGQLTSVTVGSTAGAADLPLSAGAYSTPVRDGVLHTGASYRHDPDDTAVSPADHRYNLDRLRVLQPGLDIDAAAVGGRVSARANSPDRSPLVGAMPDNAFFEREYHDLHHGRPASGYAPARHMPGVYCNVAHGSRGLTSAFLCAEIVASMIDGTPQPVDMDVLDHLNPARFLIRKLKRTRP